MADDGYVSWYQTKLWRLLPALYRTLDPGQGGPLQELVNRIGAETATLRRSIDRLWENQSIETCDDWVVPYIGDLLATRLVSCLDARAQRVDVAKTIYYRRRAGTLGLLEELAADIAGRDARAVEFFRRLGRTRHQFDPAIGPVPTFTPGSAPGSAVIQALAGACSGTPAGGFADLRNAYAAANSAGAFDEYAHTADLRRGAQSSGWHNISHLGVFIWWLQSFPAQAVTPVSNGASPPCFTFDPTGRRIPLFAPSSRSSDSFGEAWVSPDEWRLPVPVRETLWASFPAELYDAAFSVGLGAGGTYASVPSTEVRIHPEQGLFSFVAAPPVGEILSAYHFGFSSMIGAGGFDERFVSQIDEPALLVSIAGGTGLDGALGGITGSGAVQIGDSMTYAGPTAALALPADATVELRALNLARPVLRWPGAGPNAWTITGNGGELILQGLWLQGADLVLTGHFDTVRLRLATIDPGTAAAAGGGPSLFDTAMDKTPLGPSTIWIEGEIKDLILERCVTGPIRTRNGGALENLTASDSIIQSIPTHALAAAAPILDPADLAMTWKLSSDPVTQGIVGGLPAAARTALTNYTVGTAPDAGLLAALQAALAGQDRAAMEKAYPLALADLALGFSSGQVSLSRCTVLGPASLHRLSASECILDYVATVEDTQHGCVRFCAYASGSNLHQPYRSVAVPPRGPLFRSRRFGDPNYARLYRLADAAILNPGVGDTILGGAQNGSEMGAFCLEAVTLRKRGLAIKFEEYAPLGVYPVWIDAD
ncbi:MAG TPA: hypothetical protein VGM25_10275 [Caulobacteraceae bacterium]|jgi:hypothetical protein